MLILFDIDATLIRTSGTGIRAMGRAGRELYGNDFDESKADYAGRLDPLIITDLLIAHDVEPTHDEIQRFRAGYGKHLVPLLKEPGKALTCPGVPALLERLSKASGVTLGLLTGNFPETGAIKLTACGIDMSPFVVNVWGNESPHAPPARSHLPPVAMQRFKQRTGTALDPRRVTIIGDTPHDIGCAREHGCRSLGVATGQFSVAQLQDVGADRAVTDLSATSDIEQWLLSVD